MSRRCSLVVNGRAVRVSPGDTSVEAAVADGMIAPVQGAHGTAMLGQGPGPSPRRSAARGIRPEPSRLAALPLAAEAPRAESAAPVRVETRPGTLTEVAALSPHVVQAVVTLRRPLKLEPGHQVGLAFEGQEPSLLCPTLRVDGSAELNELVFHLPRGGAEPSLGDRLGTEIALRAPVQATGPEGRAAYRTGGGRLVIVSEGCGFAQAWSIARAARYIEMDREMALVVGATDPLDLYMRPALDWLRATGVSRITLTSTRSRQRPPDVRPGPLTAHVPHLLTTDVVHVCAGRAAVEAVEVLAAAAGARCHAVVLPEG
ncbi:MULTISPECIES: ferredoxin--NAD(+) reductase [Methylobacterium]|uniref:Ferredoxin--NAD(+) reductase n=1 Tax=Methylobacterium jeotgali TaxID=381630 RepID=A0ABQ4SZA2_9HYPH|nr:MULTISPECIES: ferredoxin--NAD(+) reductase [Methylobacterium]PIU04907.1 MAG: ferredoxin--NAD(+) reductase [Methylobacterium sp. CG09_land_8_20_14_0_10_71_15]PIU12862.1 MAG: ferredoxin--NAD(+) reductase [Methylobacterium sp. CG08_land_8_20_14_0_20_71_15]GBU17548.1 hypothetical protein AwMethylo_17630 [Methylobacterium sp.]GJE07104.1 hypothetical protein AOPFMNJM_2428 [Methylobacterium jeotgali]